MCGTAKKIVILVYDGVQALDMTAPLDALASANALRPGSYEIVVAGLDAGTVKSEAGLRLVADAQLDEVEDIDTLLMPGGMGLRMAGPEKMGIMMLRTGRGSLK